jgi:hypothetical protein
VLMGAETVSYVLSLYSAKNPPKPVGVSSLIILSSTSGVLYCNFVLTYPEIPLQDDINVYRSTHPMPDIERPSHLMPSRPPAVFVSEEDNEGTDDDRTLSDVMKGKKAKTSQEGQSSSGSDSLPSHPKGLRATTRKCKASAVSGGNEDERPR